jgi:photosystem II stability/assembly factor-like uncharacterized protein
MLLHSENGHQWLPSTRLPLREDSQSLCDWHSLAMAEGDIWLAGAPGTIMLTSGDLGKSWSARPTGEPGIISAVEFLDEQRGWAVGAQGKIWATRDSGQSWYAQRHAQRKFGVLAIAQAASQIPWSP